MLLELHVRNLALIERADVEFGRGLNILTGETGAGKSIIIGSVNLALGQKAPRDIIRTGADSAYIELIFSVEPERKKALEALEVTPDEEGTLIVSRRITPSRSVSRINDETVTVARLRQITSLLLDIHGQHDHQSLLHASRHLEILDAFIKEASAPLKQEIGTLFRRYRELEDALSEGASDGESRRREADFLRFEIGEIEDAALEEGEEESLTEQYRKYSNGRRIIECLSAAYQAVETDGTGYALQQVGQVVSYDGQLRGIQDQLYDAEAILNDTRHDGAVRP